MTRGEKGTIRPVIKTVAKPLPKGWRPQVGDIVLLGNGQPERRVVRLIRNVVVFEDGSAGTVR